jgi:hypothetical protein
MKREGRLEFQAASAFWAQKLATGNSQLATQSQNLLRSRRTQKLAAGSSKLMAE